MSAEQVLSSELPQERQISPFIGVVATHDTVYVNLQEPEGLGLTQQNNLELQGEATTFSTFYDEEARSIGGLVVSSEAASSLDPQELARFSDEKEAAKQRVEAVIAETWSKLKTLALPAAPPQSRERMKLDIPPGYASKKGKRNTSARSRQDEDLVIEPDSLQLLLREAGKIPLLSPEEEIDLAKRIERGDTAAKDRMINSNLRLVVANARRYQGQGLSMNDVTQEGMIGLIRATEKFDWRRGFRFSTYATLWIRQAIQRGLENTSRTIRLPVHVGQLSRKIGHIERELIAKFGHEPTDEEIAAAADLSVESVREARKADKSVVSLDKPLGDDGDSVFGDLLALEAPAVDEEVHEILKSETLLNAIAELPENERDVIEMRFGIGYKEPHTLSKAGRKIGVSTERACQIEERALKRLSQRPELIHLNNADML
jgi:RNA polymerase primary sigma factor